MTPAEAANYLGVHPDTVRLWIKETLSGAGTQLSGVRVDRCRKTPRYYVDADEVRTLCDRNPEEYA